MMCRTRAVNALFSLFSRLNAAGPTFEPQRNLVYYAKGLDRGLSVAVGNRGDAHVVWDAMGKFSEEAHLVY